MEDGSGSHNIFDLFLWYRIRDGHHCVDKLPRLDECSGGSLEEEVLGDDVDLSQEGLDVLADLPSVAILHFIPRTPPPRENETYHIISHSVRERENDLGTGRKDDHSFFRV